MKRTDRCMSKIRVHFLVKALLLLVGIMQLNIVLGKQESVGGHSPFYFKKISVKDGLSHSTVNCFFEDSLGFMWVGTYDGLNRYDGIKFKSYGQKDGLSSNNVLDIIGDDDGNLWLATGMGLTKYNPKSEIFTPYIDSTSFNFFTNLLLDTKNNRIWIGADEGGLKYFDLQSMQIESFDAFKYKSARARELIYLNDHELLIGTHHKGVFKLDLQTMEVLPFLNDTTSNFKLPGNKIWQIVKDENSLIISVEGAGVCLYNMETSSHFMINKENSNLGNNKVSSLGIDYKGNILIGSDGGGFNYYDKKFQSVYNYQKQEADLRSISSNSIRSIYRDTQDNIWIGTFNGGINFINKFNQNIFYFGKNILDANSLSNNEVTAFLPDRDGGMWIGTDKGGLNHLKNGNFTFITQGNNDHQMNDNVVMTLAYDLNDNILIGTYVGGLNILKGDKVIKYPFEIDNPKGISDNWVWDIEVDQAGNYWLAVINGLNKFDPATETFTRYEATTDESAKFLPINNVTCLLLDSREDLWVGTFGGLGKFNLENEEYEFMITKEQANSGLKNGTIVTIFEDSKNNIWVGTFGGGLGLLDQENLSFSLYEVKDGLPSDVIQSIEEDDHGNLWISTLKGIAKFDPNSEFFQVMDENYGLQSDEFKYNASTKDDNGFLYFGGINGFNVFHPDSIHFPNISNPVIITDFQIYNESLAVGDETKLLSKSISFTDGITMTHKKSRFFSVHYTLPNFSIPNKLSFAYKLEGFNDDWVYVGGERKVTFTNLNPGEYTLKLKQSSNDYWTDDFATLKIRIVPPFYLRKEFLGFSLLLLVLGIYGIFKYRTGQLEKRKVELEKVVDKQHQEIKKQNKEITKQNSELINQNVKLTKTQIELEDVNNTLEDKVKDRTKKLNQTIDQLNKSVSELDRFVYSASHDLSAPLKSIQGLVNIARIENRQENLGVHLDYIETSIEKLESVIKDLIQFSRNSRSEVDLREVNVYDFLNEIVNSLKYMSESDNFSIFLKTEKDFVISSDKQRLQMIVENLISNSIKYQDTEKDLRWVKIETIQEASCWKILVEDNGVGISKEHQDKVFQMFYRASEDSDGTGLGLYIVREAVEKLGGEITMTSTLATGTTFEIEFKNKS